MLRKDYSSKGYFCILNWRTVIINFYTSLVWVWEYCQGSASKEHLGRSGPRNATHKYFVGRVQSCPVALVTNHHIRSLELRSYYLIDQEAGNSNVLVGFLRFRGEFISFFSSQQLFTAWAVIPNHWLPLPSFIHSPFYHSLTPTSIIHSLTSIVHSLPFHHSFISLPSFLHPFFNSDSAFLGPCDDPMPIQIAPDNLPVLSVSSFNQLSQRKHLQVLDMGIFGSHRAR